MKGRLTSKRPDIARQKKKKKTEYQFISDFSLGLPCRIMQITIKLGTAGKSSNEDTPKDD